MKTSTMISLAGIALIAIIAYSCLYVVREIDRAVLLTFGEVTNVNVQPGLHFKIPGAQTTRIFDGRVQTLDAPTQSFLTAEREFLEVDSYAQWRIADVQTYYTRTSGDANVANNLLGQRINTGLRNQFAGRTVYEVVSGQREELMEELTQNMNVMAYNELGIEIVDIRVKQIDLPQDVEESVYNRMITERQQEAAEARSTGRELAEGIRADADRQRTVILAEARRDSEIVRGEGDAEATSIYAEAFGQNPEFFEFTRSLDAYRQTFSDTGDMLVLSPNSDFFKYLNRSNLITSDTSSEE